MKKFNEIKTGDKIIQLRHEYNLYDSLKSVSITEHKVRIKSHYGRIDPNEYWVTIDSTDYSDRIFRGINLRGEMKKFDMSIFEYDHNLYFSDQETFEFWINSKIQNKQKELSMIKDQIKYISDVKEGFKISDNDDLIKYSKSFDVRMFLK